MAKALGPFHLQGVVPGVGSGGILVDDSVGGIRFGREAGGRRTLIVKSGRTRWVICGVTIIRPVVNVSKDCRGISFLELNDMHRPSAHIADRDGLIAGEFAV